MLAKDLKEDQRIKDWLTNTTTSKHTSKLYVYNMQHYTEFVKMTPEELLAEAEEDEEKRIKPSKSRLYTHLTEYRSYLQKESFAPMTVKNHMATVCSFYDQYEIKLPKLSRNEFKARPLEKNLPIPEKEQLQAILRHCDQLEKCIVLIGASSGLSSQEICNLRVGDFKKGYDEKTGVTVLQLRRTKEQWDFVTYLSPEASQAILDYLDYRSRETRRQGEYRRNQLEKQRVNSNSDYLLIRRKISDKYIKTRNEELRKLSGKAICAIYVELAERAHLSTPKGDWGLVRSHNVRKVFNSTLKNIDANETVVEYLMGHTIDDTQASYFRADAKGKLKDTYMKYMPNLMLTEKYDPQKDPSFHKLKEENKALARVVENTAYESKTARNEVEEFRAQLEKAHQKIAEAETIKAEIREIKLSMKFYKEIVKKVMAGETSPDWLVERPILTKEALNNILGKDK